MAISLDLSGVQSTFEAIPAGKYLVTLTSLRNKTSSTGKPMLEWIFTVADSEFRRRKLFVNTILQKEFLWKTKQLLIGLGMTKEELAGNVDIEPAELIGLQAIALVSVRALQDGSNGNHVDNLIQLEPEEHTESGVPEFAMADLAEMNPSPTSGPSITAAARALAQANGIDVSGIVGTGINGTITKSDVEALITTAA